MLTVRVERSEAMKAHLHRIRCDAILWQMRQDLRRTLDEFAASIGVPR